MNSIWVSMSIEFHISFDRLMESFLYWCDTEIQLGKICFRSSYLTSFEAFIVPEFTWFNIHFSQASQFIVPSLQSRNESNFCLFAEIESFLRTNCAILSAESSPLIWPIATVFLSWLCLCRIKYFTLLVMFTISRLSGHLGLKSFNAETIKIYKNFPLLLNINTYAVIITSNMFAISVAKTWITIIGCYYNERNHHQNPYNQEKKNIRENFTLKNDFG